MPVKKFSILIIPEGSHKVRRFLVSRKALTIVGSTVGVMLLILFAISIDYLRTKVDRHELTRLRSENHEQQKELRLLATRLEDLRKEMVVLAQNDAKVRAMAQLGRSKSEIQVGVGGPPEESLGADLAGIQRQIDQMREAIDLRRESQEELHGFLADQRSLFSAKPKGWPVHGWTTSGFGVRMSPFSGNRVMHEGIDIAARIGTPIHSPADGVVTQAEFVDGYGRLVVLDHGYGYKTYYGHNSKTFVKVGQKVRRGDLLAAVGNSGSSTGSHLHYEVRFNGVPVNPKKFL